MSSEELGGWPGPPRPGLALNLTLRGGSSALGEIIACRELQTAACSKHTGKGNRWQSVYWKLLIRWQN